MYVTTQIRHKSKTDVRKADVIEVVSTQETH